MLRSVQHPFQHISTCKSSQQWARRVLDNIYAYRANGTVSSTPKPILLIDVDGVINFTGNSCWPVAKQAKVMHEKRKYLITWSPVVVEKLNLWFDSGLAEIRWLTTWDKYAQDNLAPALGLRHFELARDPVENIDKDVAADRTVLAEPGRPIVWIDDDVSYYVRRIRSNWMAKNTTLIVQPDTRIGLTPEQLATIESFLVSARENRFQPNNGHSSSKTSKMNWSGVSPLFND